MLSVDKVESAQSAEETHAEAASIHLLITFCFLPMYYRKLCTLNVQSFLSRFTKLCRTISNQDVERPNILSAHTLCIYLFASELKQLTSLCNNQNKVFATFMCTQLTGDSPACSKLSGREKERKAPAANFATRDSNPCSVWWGKDEVSYLQILQIPSPLKTLFRGVRKRLLVTLLSIKLAHETWDLDFSSVFQKVIKRVKGDTCW